jgi:hypothetical protein
MASLPRKIAIVAGTWSAVVAPITLIIALSVSTDHREVRDTAHLRAVLHQARVSYEEARRFSAEQRQAAAE